MLRDVKKNRGWARPVSAVLGVARCGKARNEIVMTKKPAKRCNPADIEFTLSDLKMIWRSLRAIESDSDRRASFWRDHIVLKQYKSPLQRTVAARRLDQETRLHRTAKELANKIEQRMRWLP